MWIVKWFKTEAEAKAYMKKRGGNLAKNIPRSHTRKEHSQWASYFGFDPDESPYTVAVREKE